MKPLLLLPVLLLSACCNQHAEKAEKPSPRFIAKSIESDRSYNAAVEITDTKTGRVYLLNPDGGAPVEVLP